MVVESRLNAYIRDNGIRQSFICERANVDADMLSRCLNGKQEMRLDIFEKICHALRKDPNDFIKPDEVEIE